VVEAVRSLIEHSGHDHLEVVVVYDTSTPPKGLDQLRAVAPRQLRLIPYDRPFDFSEKCNIGVLAAQGDVVVLLNDDVEIVSDDFVAQLVAPRFEDGVGRTGGRLLPPDGRIQSAGLAIDQRLEHLRRGHIVDLGPFHIGESARLRVGSATITNHEVSGISAACLAIKKSLYLEVGGLSEELPLNFGDVDLSLKVREAGYRLLWMADPTAYHFAAHSRHPLVHAREVRTLNRRWLLPNHDRYVPHLPESRPPSGGKHPARQAARARWQ